VRKLPRLYFDWQLKVYCSDFGSAQLLDRKIHQKTPRALRLPLKLIDRWHNTGVQNTITTCLTCQRPSESKSQLLLRSSMALFVLFGDLSSSYSVERTNLKIRSGIESAVHCPTSSNPVDQLEFPGHQSCHICKFGERKLKAYSGGVLSKNHAVPPVASS